MTSISGIKLPKHSALQKDVVPPQEVGRSSLQQLEPTSAGPAAARSSDRRQVFVDGEMRLCEKG